MNAFTHPAPAMHSGDLRERFGVDYDASLRTSRFTAVEDNLPSVGEVVDVAGVYVPPGTGFPRARFGMQGVGDRSQWSSIEWRGMVGITHWRRIALTVAPASPERPRARRRR